ncbi:MAG: hypothetical protein V1787_00125 [Candidatus Micrarchaeota archaeon]
MLKSFVSENRGSLRLAALAAVALLFAVIVFQTNEDVNKAIWQTGSWMNPVVTLEESKSVQWVLENTNERDVFVTDIFGGEHLMGNTLREGTEGGDWAIVPGVVDRMAKIDEFYKTKDADKAAEIAKKYKAKYVLMPNRQVFAGFGWLEPERGKMVPPYFVRVYEDNGFEIYTVN